MTIELLIPMDPATMPSAQHKGIAPNGKVYTKAAVRRTKWAIAKLANLMTPRDKIAASWTLTKDQPWRATIVYAYKLAGTPKRLQGGYKVTRPDVDNLTKLVLDALTASRVAWRDDAQVAELLVCKQHADAGEEAHIYIALSPILDTNPEREEEDQ